MFNFLKTLKIPFLKIFKIFENLEFENVKNF